MSINGSGEISTTELSIEERKGAVVMFLGEHYVIMPPEQSIAIGDILSDYGYSAAGLTKPGGAKIPTKLEQEKIENRVALVIKNLNDRNVAAPRMAKELVDVVLREVL